MIDETHPERTARLEIASYRHDREIAVHTEQINGIRDDLAALRNEVTRLRSALVTAAMSFAGGSGLLAFTIYTAFGK